MKKIKDINIKQVVRISLSSLMVAIVFLSGCIGDDLLNIVFPEEGLDQIEEDLQDSLQQPEPVLTPAPTITPQLLENISIWIPPQFGPDAKTESGKIMLSHIASFRDQYPGFEIDLRVKADSGSSSMINSLLVASSVAPSTLPSLVLISHSDIEQAVELGLIQPIQEFSAIFDENDWFSVAEKMSMYHDEVYGLPFASDAIGLIQHTNTIGSAYVPLANSDELLNTINFAAGSPDSLVPFLYYQSIGGMFTVDMGHVTMDESLINEVLLSFKTYHEIGLFPNTLLNFQSEEQLWDAFKSNQVENMITWLSLPQAEGGDYFLSPVPSIGTDPISYGKGWVWCLVIQETNAIKPNIIFLEHIIDSNFLTEWTPTTAYLPVRTSSIAGWNELQRESIRTILQSAELLPEEIVLSKINSDMIIELQNVILGSSSPEESTLAIMDKLSEDLTNEE
jgi:hypothetical protein